MYKVYWNREIAPQFLGLFWGNLTSFYCHFVLDTLSTTHTPSSVDIERFEDMRSLDGVTIFEISNGASELDHAVIGASRKSECFGGGGEQVFYFRREGNTFYQISRRHIAVYFYIAFVFLKTLCLLCASTHHSRANSITLATHPLFCQMFVLNLRYFHPQINTVNNRPGHFLSIARDSLRIAGAGFAFHSKNPHGQGLSAATKINRAGNEPNPSLERRSLLSSSGSRNASITFRSNSGIHHEKHSAVCERDLPGFGVAPPPREKHRTRCDGRTKWSVWDDRLFKNPCDRVDTRHLKHFFVSEWWRIPVNALASMVLPVPGGP